MAPAGPFEAGSRTSIVFRLAIGTAGIREGGCLKIAIPNMGWGRPVCLTPRDWDERLIGTDRQHNPWKPINTTWRIESLGNATLRLRADESWPGADPSCFPLNPELAEMFCHWRWWITGTVERDHLMPGDVIEVTYGDVDNEPYGIGVQPWPERLPVGFAAVIDSAGDRCFAMPAGSPQPLEVVPGPAEKIVAVAPSVVDVNDRIAVRAAVLDRNLCPPADDYLDPLSFRAKEVDLETDTAASGQTVHGSACASGIARIGVAGPNLEAVQTNPVMIEEGAEYRLFWGDLHAQSRYHQWVPARQCGDSCCSPRELHAYARDGSMLDFTAVTDGFGAYATSPGWAETQQAAIEAYEPGRYVSLKGWECGMGPQGDKCVIYRSADMEPCIKPMSTVVAEGGAPTQADALIRFYKEHAERVLTIPHSFMKYLDWSVMDPELDRVMEIYSCWGSYESRDDNPLNDKRKPRNQSAQHAWRSGLLLGITAAGDSHLGYPGRSLSYADRYWCQHYKAGLCAVYSKALTREGVWDALYDRRCYGTTGVRIVLKFELNGALMGSVLEYDPDAAALINRRISVRVAGTDWIRRVDVLKNNRLIHRHEPASDEASFVFTDTLQQPCATRDWYYVRIFQADGNAAWSSPIWVAPRGCEQPSPSEKE